MIQILVRDLTIQIREMAVQDHATIIKIRDVQRKIAIQEEWRTQVYIFARFNNYFREGFIVKSPRISTSEELICQVLNFY